MTSTLTEIGMDLPDIKILVEAAKKTEQLKALGWPCFNQSLPCFNQSYCVSVFTLYFLVLIACSLMMRTLPCFSYPLLSSLSLLSYLFSNPRFSYTLLSPSLLLPSSLLPSSLLPSLLSPSSLFPLLSSLSLLHYLFSLTIFSYPHFSLTFSSLLPAHLLPLTSLRIYIHRSGIGRGDSGGRRRGRRLP